VAETTTIVKIVEPVHGSHTRRRDVQPHPHPQFINFDDALNRSVSTS
jgi:hypothetical protein